MLLVLAVGFISEWIISLWLSFALIVGAKDIPFENIVKIHFISMSFFCLSNMLSFEMGWTSNVIQGERENIFGDTLERNRYGYMAATDYANHVLYILLDLWILKDGKYSLLQCLAIGYIGYFIYINCGARLATLCILLTVFLSPLIIYMENHKNWFCSIVKTSLVYSIPVFAVVSMCLTYFYNPNNDVWMILDIFFSGRLGWAQDSLFQNGTPWFGQAIEMYGTGNAGQGAAAYDYVDSSYVQFYIRWGIILTTTIIFSLFVIGRKAFKRNHVVLLFSLMIAGLAGIFCQFLFHLGYCVLLLAFCSSHYYRDDSSQAKLIC